MRFKPKYNQYELRFLQVLVPKERLNEIIIDLYSTCLNELFLQGSSLRTDGAEWLKGIVTDEDEKDE